MTKAKLTSLSPDDKQRYSRMIKAMSVEINDCWFWAGSKRGDGYGGIRYKGINTLAHRISFLSSNGDLTETEVVRHLCGNRLCVNPSHLKKGSHAENAADAIEGGSAIFSSKRGQKDKKAWQKKISDTKAKMYGKKIIRLSDGKEWRGLKRTAAELGTSGRHLKRCAEEGRELNGELYRIEDDALITVYSPSLNLKGAKNGRAKKVQCINTKEVFETMSDAAKSINVTQSAISHAIKYGKTSGNKHWKFYEKKEK